MKLFGREAPGVEWVEDPATTAPITSPDPVANPFPPSCTACAGPLGIDGYCQQCGQKARSLRDHYELVPADWLAGVCDIGQLHARNEDALACQAGAGRAVIVVCDGVTTSEDSDVASLAAARTACDLLWANDPQGMGTPSSRVAALGALLTQAVSSANQAVIDCSSPDSPNSAASTFAAAIVDADGIYCANLGDSRIYWLPDDGPARQLSKDHSLAQDGIDAGAGRAEAESSIYAHTITRWLGRDATELTPYLDSVQPSTIGWLIVCSDGLWNYASDAEAVRALVNQFCQAGPLVLAQRLVAWANEQGGHDNITVACARLGQVDPGQIGQADPVGQNQQDIPAEADDLTVPIVRTEPTDPTVPILASTLTDQAVPVEPVEATNQGATPSSTDSLTAAAETPAESAPAE